MIVDAEDILIISALFLIIDCAYWTIFHVRSSFVIHCYLFSHIIVRYIISFYTQNGESRIPGNIDNIHLCVSRIKQKLIQLISLMHLKLYMN